MKTIEITDEMYSALMEISQGMNSQDHHGTRMPYIWQIETTEDIAAYEGCGISIWVDSEGVELRTDEEIKEHIINYICENDEDLFVLDTKSVLEKSESIFNEMDEDDIDAWLEGHDFRKVEVTTAHKYENAFFTLEACKLHIESNNYHYKKPRPYLNHAFRNPEMETISTFLCELSGGKLHT